MSRPARTLRAAAALTALAAATTGAALAGTPAQAAKTPGVTSAVGTVFFPDPVQSTGDQSLTDADDADSPGFAKAYRSVTLTGLDGSGTLTGRYVAVKSTTGPAAVLTGAAFPAYHRDDDRFEQVMGYYWATRAQDYLQSLGFGTVRRPVNQRQIQLRINQSGKENSFYRDEKGGITLVMGVVDDG